MSDQHKGQRDGADDFAACEATYTAGTAGSSATTTICGWMPTPLSGADGNITGIEIEGEDIRLVRWSGAGADSRVEVLAADTLPRVFAELEAGVQSTARTPTSST